MRVPIATGPHARPAYSFACPMLPPPSIAIKHNASESSPSLGAPSVFTICVDALEQPPSSPPPFFEAAPMSGFWSSSSSACGLRTKRAPDRCEPLGEAIN
eukprot:1126517-Rhodomonas_salina.1